MRQHHRRTISASSFCRFSFIICFITLLLLQSSVRACYFKAVDLFLDPIDNTPAGRWATPDPLPFSVSYRYGGSPGDTDYFYYEFATDQGFQAWNSYTNGNLRFVQGGSAPTVYWSSESAMFEEFFGQKTLASTIPIYDSFSHHLISYVTYVNLADFSPWDWSPFGESGKFSFRAVMLHEAGHALGLLDLPYKATTMRSDVMDCPTVLRWLDRGEDRTVLGEWDKQAAQSLYACPHDVTWSCVKGLYIGNHFLDKASALSGTSNTLLWTKGSSSPSARYNVYRTEDGSETVQLLGTVADSIFVDNATAFGKRYSYHVATSDGTTLTEIGSPSAGLKLVNDFIIPDMLSASWGSAAAYMESSLEVHGNRVYAALDNSASGGSEIRTYDVTNPAQVVELGRHAALDQVSMISLSEDGTKLYAVVYSSSSYGLIIFDATQPSLPIIKRVAGICGSASGEGVFNIAIGDDFVYLACGTAGLKAVVLDDATSAYVAGSYSSGASRTTLDVQLMGDRIYTFSRSAVANGGERYDLLATNKVVFGQTYLTFTVECSSNQLCWPSFSPSTQLLMRPARGHFALERTQSTSTPYRLVNAIDPQAPTPMRVIDAPSSGAPSPVAAPTFESVDFDSRFAYAITPLFQDKFDRGLVAFDLWAPGPSLLYAGGDLLGYGGDGTVRSQGKYLYVLDILHENYELHNTKARLRIYEKASGGQPDPVHPVRLFPPSDAYKLGQDVGVSLAVGCPTSVHIQLLQDGSVVGDVSTQEFAIADDVARSALWPMACSTTHLENHSYAFRATATYAGSASATFLSDPFRIEIGAKREVATAGKPFTSIQDAIDASASGDTILVYPGSYNEKLTLKSNVRIIGKPGAVIVASGTSPAVTDSALVFPPMLDGLVFHLAPGATTGAISVKNCGIQVKNCTFTSLYRAVSISSGHAQFTSCIFANNQDTAGFGAAVWLDADAVQATTFTDCQFTNNSVTTRGGAVYLGSTGTYSALAPQVAFVRCAFTGNSAPEAAAVRVGTNRRPSFDHCIFSSNHPASASAGSVVGGTGGVSATLENCTFVSNSSSQSFDVIRLEPGGTVPLPTIDATIFASSSGGNALGSSYGGTYAVAHSDFFGNSVGDAMWAANGTGNFSDNPAFCPGTDYTIYAFSPCVPGVKYTSLVGAKDVACVPNAIVTVLPGGTNPPDNYLLTCPKGDGDALDVEVKLDPGVMTRAPEAKELAIQAPYASNYVYSNKTITSAVPATGPNYTMEINHKYLSGYTWLPLTIYLNGHPLAQQALIRRRSVDIAGGPNAPPPLTKPDGRVSLADFNRFVEGFSYAGHTVPYDSLCDIDADGVVNNSDFGKLSFHYQNPEHHQPFVSTDLEMKFPSESAISDAHVTMQFTEEYVTSTDRRLNVDLSLEEASGATACIFAVKTNRSDLRFLGWGKDNPNVLFANVTADSVEQLYVGIGYPSAYTKSKESLGRMVFDIDGNAPIDIADDEFILTVGDIELMGVDNQTYGAQLSGVMGRTIKGSVQKLFHNRLEQNFPNPFNPQTTIAFSIQKASNVHLSIYDVTGSRVRDLVDEKRVPGAYRVVWDGLNQSGNSVASGVYFYKLTAGTFTSAKKMVLLK